MPPSNLCKGLDNACGSGSNAVSSMVTLICVELINPTRVFWLFIVFQKQAIWHKTSSHVKMITHWILSQLGKHWLTHPTVWLVTGNLLRQPFISIPRFTRGFTTIVTWPILLGRIWFVADATFLIRQCISARTAADFRSETFFLVIQIALNFSTNTRLNLSITHTSWRSPS